MVVLRGAAGGGWQSTGTPAWCSGVKEREFFIDNLRVRIVMIRWTGLAPWEFEFPFPGSLTSTVLAHRHVLAFDFGVQSTGTPAWYTTGYETLDHVWCAGVTAQHAQGITGVPRS